MSIENEKYFGDKKSFAIRYVPGYSDQSKKYFYANCHLVLNGQIIGDKKEVCHLNSWKYSLEQSTASARETILSGNAPR